MVGNYPMGVDGSSDYFNKPEPPECEDCGMQLEWEWHFCPSCGKPTKGEDDDD